MKTDEEQGKYDIEKIRKDNAILRKYAVIQKAQDEKVCVQTAYIDLTQDLESALVLDELIFFTLPRDGGRSGLRVWKDGYLWMAVQRSDWWNRKRLKPRQADLAIEKLEKQGLIFSSVHKFNGVNTVHIRLNVEFFFQSLSELLEKQNPPESEENTEKVEINDLYEMMGISGLRNGDLEPSRLQNGHEGLRNGQILNSPNNNPNINNPEEENSKSQKEQALQERQEELREHLAENDVVSAVILGRPVGKALNKQAEIFEFETMICEQLARLRYNFEGDREPEKESFRKFLKIKRKIGQELETWVNWWMSDEWRVANPPWNLTAIKTKWLQAFPKNKPSNNVETDANGIPVSY